MGKKLKTAVIGCGKISAIYFKNMMTVFDTLDVVACTSKHMDSARKAAETYGIRACTMDEIMEDPEIEMIVNLTPVPAHYDIIRRALLSGKHVFTEKAMTETLSQAEELLQLAKEKGLWLCSAPETFLGAGIQTVKKALDDGLIGEVTSFSIAANRNIDILASIFEFLKLPKGGALYDYGVYYLTALTYLLGETEKVSALLENPYPKKRNIIPDMPNFGQEYSYENECIVSAVMKLKSGVTGTFHLNNESLIQDDTGFTIFGKKGILKCPNPNEFGGDVIYIPESSFMEPVQMQVLPCEFPYADNMRGIGPSDLAVAIEEGRRPACDASMAYHVLALMEAMERSSKEERFVYVD